MAGQQLVDPASLHPAGNALRHPWLRARQEWDRRIGEPFKRSANQMRLNALMALAICALTYGLVRSGQNVHVYPYVVEVCTEGAPVGEVRAIGTIPQPWLGQTSGPIRFVVQNWVERMRNLGDSPVLFQQNWEYLKQFMTGKAIGIAVSFMQEQQKRQKEGTVVQIELISLLPMTEDFRTLQVEWIERTYNQSGLLTSKETWGGLIDIAVYEPQDYNNIKAQRNPLGIFITHYVWDTKKEGKEKKS